jgi:hypothetical protein
MPGTKEKVGTGAGKLFRNGFADPFTGSCNDYIHNDIIKSKHPGSNIA